VRRTLAAVVAVVALAAAGCGQSPEDEAHDAGKNIGEELYSLRTATNAGQAQESVADIRKEFADVKEDLSPDAQQRISGIAEDLENSLKDASTPAERSQAFANAFSQMQALRSDTDSVINQFVAGIQEGYASAD
jgi:hypothetical protein